MRLELTFFPTEHRILNSSYGGNECILLQLSGLVLLEKIYNIFLSSKQSLVSRYSSSVTLVHFPPNLFQPLSMTLLPLQKRNRAICRLNIGYWLETLVKIFPENLLDSNCTVSLSSATSRCFQNHFILIPAIAACTRRMQLFIPSSSAKKKLLEFTMLLYFVSWKITYKNFFS